MAKKASRRAAREERDEDEIEREDVDDGHAAPARRARAARADDHGHDDHGHDDHDHDHEDEEEDAYWWSPYGVMGGLVVIGVLGFFGAFNSIAAKVMGTPAPAVAAAADTQATPPPTPPSHATAPNPHGAHPGMPGAAQGETYGAKHLLVMYKGSMRAPANITRTKEEAKKRAEEAQKKAKAPGAKFEDIVKEYSDEPGAGARGGDLGTFRKGSMVPQFQEAVEKMKVNDISGLVETPFGYHVILRTK